MNQDQYQRLSQWINAHLDGHLDADQRRTFEQTRSQSAVMRAELERQTTIDEALRRLFAPPPVEAILARVMGSRSDASSAPIRKARMNPWIWRTAVAAAVIVMAAGGWWGWMAWQDKSSISHRQVAELLPKVRMEEAYQQLVSNGFKPKWLCSDEREFATTFYFRLRQGMAFKNAPAGVAMVGLSYFNCMSPNTIVFLAEVQCEKVIVFIDEASNDVGQSLPSDSRLHLFRRKIDKLMLYEVTPLDKPSLLDFFRPLDVPNEWLKNATYRP